MTSSNDQYTTRVRVVQSKHAQCATSLIDAMRGNIRYRLDRVRMYGDAPPSRDEWVKFLTELDGDLRYIDGEFGDMLIAHGEDLAEREAEYADALERAAMKFEHGGPLT